MSDFEELLRPAVEMLDADGYRLEIAHVDGRLTLSILASESACADCLVPKRIMRNIFDSMLATEADAPSYELVYPTEPEGWLVADTDQG